MELLPLSVCVLCGLLLLACFRARNSTDALLHVMPLTGCFVAWTALWIATIQYLARDAWERDYWLGLVLAPAWLAGAYYAGQFHSKRLIEQLSLLYLFFCITRLMHIVERNDLRTAAPRPLEQIYWSCWPSLVLWLEANQIEHRAAVY